MAASIWANRRLVLTVERAVYSHDSQFITAPDGYRVVSGGWAAANPDNFTIQNSSPSCGSDPVNGTPGVPEGWFFEFDAYGEGTVVNFFVICEADPMGTLLVTIPYGS